MNEEYYSVNYTEMDAKDYEGIANMMLQRNPTPAIIFSLNGEEVLKIEPGKFTTGGESLPDVDAVYERLSAWITKVESLGRPKSRLYVFWLGCWEQIAEAIVTTINLPATIYRLIKQTIKNARR